jgi:hypothetical protein
MGPVVAGMEADRRGGGGWYGAFGRYGGMRGGEGVCWTFSLSGKGRTRTRTSWTGRGGLWVSGSRRLYRNDRIVPLCGPTSGREEVRSGRGCILVRARCRLRVAVGARGGLNGGRGAANATQRHTQVSESERHVAGSPLG